VLVGRNAESLAATAADIQAPTKAITCAADVVSLDECESIFQTTVAEFGHVDALINTAGVMNVGPIGGIDPLQWWQNFVSTTVKIGKQSNKLN
jgi:NADP-dependent 3-hydroxy acid dehydrogenase YdfG